MSRKISICLSVMLVLSLSACIGFSPALSAKNQAVALRIGWLGYPDTLNPASATLTESYTIFDLIYSTLITDRPDGGYTGGLAKSWNYLDGGLTWVIKLKSNIQWQNGSEFTSRDVVRAISSFMERPDAWATLANYVEGFKEVSAPDAGTVQITLDHPISNMEYRLSCLYIIYADDFSHLNTPEDLQNFKNFRPVGTGPFEINSVDEQGGTLVLDANRLYFDGAPKIDQVVFQPFDDSDQLVRAMIDGDIDLISEVPQADFGKLKNTNTVEVVTTPGNYFNELIINSAPADHDPAPHRNPALEDPQVRLALATAIDKNELVNRILIGLGESGDTIVPPTLGGGFWHDTAVQDVAFDIAQASRILEDAGYTLGADGVRSKDGVRLDFRLQYPSGTALYSQAAAMLTVWFKQAGIKTAPEAVDSDTLIANTTPKGDFDLLIWGWGPDPDPDFILSVLTSDQFINGGWNDSGYSNPEYDQLYKDQQVMVDQNARQQIVWKMQQIAYNDRPYIVLWYEELIQAYRYDRFKNFIQSPLGIEAAVSLRQVEPVH